MESQPTDQPKNQENDNNSPKHDTFSLATGLLSVARFPCSRPRGDCDSHWKSGDFGNRIAALKLPFSLFLALRYLKPKRTFISIITLVSILGVTLGVTVLILVISVMTGFDRELRQKVIDFDAHILVTTEEHHDELARPHGEDPTTRRAWSRPRPTSKGR